MLSNVDIIKKFYESFKTKDRQTCLQVCSEDIEWTVLKGMPNGGTFVGRDAVFDRYFPELLSSFSEFHAVPEEFLEAGENVIVLGRYRGIGKSTGRPFDSPFVHVYTLKDSRISRFRQYTDTHEIQSTLR